MSGNTASTGRLSQRRRDHHRQAGGAAIVNSTISGNTAVDTTTTGNASQGGGIASSGGLSFNGVTIANNTAATAAGLYATVTGAAAPPARTIANTIVGGNTGAECGGNSFATDTTRNNVSDDTTCSFTAATDRQGFSARLGALANNGGNTNTHALLPASPAINNGGACATTDQRGIARPQPAGGQCDVGAYEYRAADAARHHRGDQRRRRHADGGASSIHVRQDGGDVKGSPQPGNAAGTTYTLDAGGTYVSRRRRVAGYAEASPGLRGERQHHARRGPERHVHDHRKRHRADAEGDHAGRQRRRRHAGTGQLHRAADRDGDEPQRARHGDRDAYTLVAGRQYTVSATR